jgi:hypothetical protein
LSDNISQSGLSKQRGCLDIVEHLENSLCGIDYPKVNYGVNPDSNIVYGDALLLGNVHGDYPKVKFPHILDEGDNEDQAWPPEANPSTQAENAPSFILSNDFDSCRQKYYYYYCDKQINK